MESPRRSGSGSSRVIELDVHIDIDITITTTVGDYLDPAVVRAPRYHRVVAGYATTLEVQGNDPDNTTYQWEKKAPGDEVSAR